MTILITNGNPGAIATVQEKITGDWAVLVEPALIRPNEDGTYTVVIDGLLNHVEHSFNPRTKVNKLEGYSGKVTLSAKGFELWRDKGFKALHLLILLISIQVPDEDVLPCIENNTGYEDIFLKTFLPNVKEVDNKRELVKLLGDVLGNFSWHPLVSNIDSDIYTSGHKLMVAYLIDAAQHFLEHGSSIGGSWLNEEGVVLALAIQMYLDQSVEG